MISLTSPNAANRLLQQDETDTTDNEICFTGYVMDSYCIDRGTMFDLPAVKTLVSPGEHSVHCLVDVKRCVASGYQMLADPPPADDYSQVSGLHCAALRLDENGNNLMLGLARMAGDSASSCATCTGSSTGLSRGFRATVFGTLVEESDNAAGSNVPPLLAVTRVENENVLCPGEQLYTPPASAVSCSSGSYLPFIASHGALMMLSWGFLLPAGVLSAKLLKHRPNSVWFKLHRIIQPLGLVVALAGYITALAGPFNVFGSGVYDVSFFHALLGTITMALGILQPVNAYFRPHKPEEDATEHIKQKRAKWERIHKISGWVAAIVGFFTVLIGIVISGYYQDVFFIGMIVVAILLIGFIVWAKCDERKHDDINFERRATSTSVEQEQQDIAEDKMEDEA